ncbi:HAD family hydrolase [Patescibacteria group bacterium]
MNVNNTQHKKQFQAILFDLDDTLCNTSQTKKSVFSKVYDNNGSLKQATKNEFIKVALSERDRYINEAKGHQTYARIEMWERIFKKLKLTLSTREMKMLIDMYWKYSSEELTLFPNAKEVLEKIFNTEIITAVFAGGDFYSKASKLVKLNIDMYFNYVFTSDLIKLPKNDPKIYKWVARFIKCKPENILVVGNNPILDIEPANKAGMQTAQSMMYKKSVVPGRGDKRPNFIIYKLTGLLELLQINN